MTKKLKEFIFHSRELVPRSVGEMNVDDRTDWFDNAKKTHRFKKGDEVVHRDNLSQVMCVKEIIKRVVKVKTGVLDEEDKPVFVKKKMMEGILVYWWE